MTGTLRQNLANTRVTHGLMFAIVIAAALAVNLSTLRSVPFHPDESSWILMSADFDVAVLHRSPASLAVVNEQPHTQIIEYRLLNGPVAKGLIGAVRWFAGYGPDSIPQDFLWGVPWSENLAAIPSANLLNAARWPMAVLNAISAGLMLLIGRRVGGPLAGLVAALLFVFDPLMLLHNRRAMAESSLIFGILLCVFCTLRAIAARQKRRGYSLPWSIALGLAMAFAMASKQNAIVIIPACLLTMMLVHDQRQWPAILATVIVAAGVLFGMLNPMLWQQPGFAVGRMWQVRAALVDNQVRVVQASEPAKVLPNAVARLAAAFDQAFIAAPAAWDADVYLDQLEPDFRAYMSVPQHGALRTRFAMIAIVVFTLIGLLHLLAGLTHGANSARAANALILLWLVASLAFVLVFVPLLWQRYFLPTQPLIPLLAGLGVARTLELLRQPK